MRNRKDANHNEIKEHFQSKGATVYDASQAGSGFPDLVIGLEGLTVITSNLEAVKKAILKVDPKAKIYIGVNLLVEVKDGDKPPSKRKLTKAQVEWHKEWTGQVAIVKNTSQVNSLV